MVCCIRHRKLFVSYTSTTFFKIASKYLETLAQYFYQKSCYLAAKAKILLFCELPKLLFREPTMRASNSLSLDCEVAFCCIKLHFSTHFIIHTAIKQMESLKRYFKVSKTHPCEVYTHHRVIHFHFKLIL